MPMTISVSVGWIFVVLWSLVTIFAFAHNIYWATVLAGSTAAFGTFLAFMSGTLIHDAFIEYVFELTDSEAVLFITDKLMHSRTTKMVLLDDVKYAEYYPYRDSSCVILHAPYTEMEVPLWPLGVHGQDVLDFLGGRGIKVVNVQSDDRIPD